MHTIHVFEDINGGMHWGASFPSIFSVSSESGFGIGFDYSNQLTERTAIVRAVEMLSKANVPWLRLKKGTIAINFDQLRSWLSETDIACENKPKFLQETSWISGEVEIKPEVRYEVRPPTFGRIGQKTTTTVLLSVYKEDFLMTQYRRVFLSHKGADKPMIRRFDEVLKVIGFDTWLDEDAMPAGTELHRGIQKGFADSCGAVFFITPNFVDESHLRNEINYAISEKTKKGDRFSIITLAFKDGNNVRGNVPEALSAYVWKNPDSELEGLEEILKALPLSTNVQWR